MNKDAKIYIAGHRGLVGSAILRRLEREGYTSLVYRTSSELDLRNQQEVERFFEQEKPEYVFLAAAKVGGIVANNTYPADFIRDNLMIQNNIIDASYRTGIKKLLFLGSTCIYPKFAPQPMKEEHLLTGILEPTNEPYAIAKIAGIKMCQSYNRQYGTKYISAMPTNLYGENDNFDLQSSHVLPALMRKFYEAKESGSPYVEVWGTGTPKREFLYSDDLADACVFLMNNYEDSEIVNIGVGEDVSIRELAETIGRIVGYTGNIRFDETKPDGTPRKLVDVTKINGLGWKASISLEEGIRRAYNWFLENKIVAAK
ncbi:GDP-L-fucose synthase [Paenibacillus cellulosilyticus]|uniref:GDP-L-fucose synthase n=1 Tax=Paenibacillus cellulosilyticus TaxID=375489 RepID=A0A2V2Z8N8_9BACL|nr:GDP-L-fucose synthase [Paenibacillus cellulosilyticus]PWW08481.1 GDP-L-fucose synthase [Paenibacillus cellulosilyticus]QKS48065.1 GDP-L-fucose synthase [Paenibacillus cellulosilyticus]